MSYEISKIQNAELQKIAMEIDKENKDAKTGSNGKIDYSEISLFAQKASSVLSADETAYEEYAKILGSVKPEQSQAKTQTQQVQKPQKEADYTASVTFDDILEVLKQKGVNLSKNDKGKLHRMFMEADRFNATDEGSNVSVSGLASGGTDKTILFDVDKKLTLSIGEFDDFYKAVKNSDMESVKKALDVDNPTAMKNKFNQLESLYKQVTELVIKKHDDGCGIAGAGIAAFGLGSIGTFIAEMNIRDIPLATPHCWAPSPMRKTVGTLWLLGSLAIAGVTAYCAYKKDKANDELISNKTKEIEQFMAKM